MNKAEIAVVLPVYNDDEHVGEALDSLIRQTVQPAEIIAVDDGSSDESSNILSKYEYDYESVRVITHETNLGLPTALNTAIDATDKTYIARQDADDRSKPNRIERQYRFLSERPRVGVVGTEAEVINEDGVEQGKITLPSDPASVLDRRNPFVHGSVMMRREALETVDGYDPLFENAQDYDLWMRIHNAGWSLEAMSELLYQLRRSQTHLAIETYQERVLYGIVARAAPDHKRRYRKIIREGHVRDIYNTLPRHERAVFNRQSAQICIKHNSWKKALREATPALINNPLSAHTIAIVGLSIAPPSVSRRLLSLIQSF